LELDNNVVKTRTAIIMPIVGSVFLVLLFFFLKQLFYLLLAILAFSSLTSFAYFVFPFVDMLFNRIGNPFTRFWEVRWIGWVTVSGIVSLIISSGVVTAWLITYYFVITDILAISLALTALSFVRLPSMKVAIIILVLFVLYDVFWVFISPFIFKQSVMGTVALSLPNLPIVIIIPRVLSSGWSLLGLGDIVLPGLWLCYLYRFDIVNRTSFRDGYFLRAWIGYIVGFLVTLSMLLAMQLAQPALLYLVPFTLIPTLFFGWRRKELRKLWRGEVGEEVTTLQVDSTKEDSVALLQSDANNQV